MLLFGLYSFLVASFHCFFVSKEKTSSLLDLKVKVLTIHLRTLSFGYFLSSLIFVFPFFQGRSRSFRAQFFFERWGYSYYQLANNQRQQLSTVIKGDLISNDIVISGFLEEKGQHVCHLASKSSEKKHRKKPTLFAGSIQDGFQPIVFNPIWRVFNVKLTPMIELFL